MGTSTFLRFIVSFSIPHTLYLSLLFFIDVFKNIFVLTFCILLALFKMGFHFISTLLNSGFYYCIDLFPKSLPYCFTFQLNLLSEKSIFFLESFPTCIQRKSQFHLILSHYKSFPLYKFSYNASFLVDCSILCS